MGVDHIPFEFDEHRDYRSNQFPLDRKTQRVGSEYLHRYSYMKTIFKSWREIAAENAKLFTVLRIPSFCDFLSVVDAASEEGWIINLNGSSGISVADCFGQQVQFAAKEEDSCSIALETS